MVESRSSINEGRGLGLHRCDTDCRREAPVRRRDRGRRLGCGVPRQRYFFAVKASTIEAGIRPRSPIS